MKKRKRPDQSERSDGGCGGGSGSGGGFGGRRNRSCSKDSVKRHFEEQILKKKVAKTKPSL